MFKMLINMLFITNINAQMLVGGTRDEHGCIQDGGYTWCESSNSCIRPWETECITSNDCSGICPPPLPCPLPDLSIDVSNCNIVSHNDECGCQSGCPTYDCSRKECMFNSDCDHNQRCVRDSEHRYYKCVDNVNIIPDNCMEWYDGCNRCHINNGQISGCTMMYCFQRSQPYCLAYNIQKNSLNIGDICLRFCEDNSQETINRRSDCQDRTICKSIIQDTNIVNHDSCDNRAWTCQTIQLINGN